MWFARPILGGTVAIGSVYEGVAGRQDGILEDEVTVGNAEINRKWIARNLRFRW
jgi:hypothetical protein